MVWSFVIELSVKMVRICQLYTMLNLYIFYVHFKCIHCCCLLLRQSVDLHYYDGLANQDAAIRLTIGICFFCKSCIWRVHK